MLPEEFAKRVDANLKSLSVKSALNPALWLVGVTCSLGLLGLKLFVADAMLKIVFVCVIGLPLVCVCLAFLFFVFRYPEKLQSEEYQIKAETLRMLKTQGGKLRAIDAQILQSLHHNPQREVLPHQEVEK